MNTDGYGEITYEKKVTPKNDGKGIHMSYVKKYGAEFITFIVNSLIWFVIQDRFGLTAGISCIALIIIILLCAFVYLAREHYKIRKLGIVSILDSQIKGEGSTKNYMQSANHSICFIGIAATKWLKEKTVLEQTVRRICSHQTGEIRMLLLAPDAEAVGRLDTASNNTNEISLNKKIETSLKKLKELKDELNAEAGSERYSEKFEIRLYSSMPIYRLVILDHKVAYMSFYRLNSDGSDLKQLKVKPEAETKPGSNNIFETLADYFESIWNTSVKLEDYYKE